LAVIGVIGPWLSDELSASVPFPPSKVAAAIVSQASPSQAKPGRIALSHAIHRTTIEAVLEAIRLLRAQGYVLVTVSTLMNGVNTQDGTPHFTRPPATAPTPDPTPGSETVPDPSSSPGTSGEASQTGGA
jgi:hypothetical protein